MHHGLNKGKKKAKMKQTKRKLNKHSGGEVYKFVKIGGKCNIFSEIGWNIYILQY